MTKFLSEALLRYWFTRSELAVLTQLPEFNQRCFETHTIEDFQELVLFGCEVMDAMKEVSRFPLSSDIRCPLAAEVPSSFA
jgi:hypothetical protein